ncbi:recombinase RecT [Isoptericola sp. NPDC055881]
MSTEITTTTASTDLAIDPAQTGFTDMQVSALTHLGVESASEGDLAVFFHVVKRTGLDPFARQIYMIGRPSSEKDENGQWVKKVKQTIQTGIDGYRLIGRRAAAKTGEQIAVGAPEWARDDGQWLPLWTGAWGYPIAARVTIKRDGQPFTAVALFDEYKQTTRQGDLTRMWGQRPAGQLAKCAEALAWRMAFPQDLAGLYVEDELQHADSEPAGPAPRRVRQSAADVISAGRVVEHEADAEPDLASQAQQSKIAALMKGAGIIERDHALSFVTQTVGRVVGSRKELTKDEARRVIDALEADAAQRDAAEPPADTTGAES